MSVPPRRNYLVTFARGPHSPRAGGAAGRLEVPPSPPFLETASFAGSPLLAAASPRNRRGGRFHLPPAAAHTRPHDTPQRDRGGGA